MFFIGMGESYDFIANIYIHIAILLRSALAAVGVYCIGSTVNIIMHIFLLYNFYERWFTITV
jgi:hypothetical protein